MDDGWKQWMSIVGGLASIAVLTTTVCNPELFEETSRADGESTDYRFVPWGDSGGEDSEIGVDVEPPDSEDRWIQFVDPKNRPVQTDVLVSSPGMWPFESTSSGGAGFLSLPAPETDKLTGQPLAMYEIVARSEDDESGYGYWGTIEGPADEVLASDAKNVELKEGHSLELEVVDKNGVPIDGAYIRLGRDSVGLVHLEYTTDPDGRADFENLPEQSYYASVDADGYAGTSVTIDHGGDLSEPLRVTLEDGGGFRVPYAWRGPPVQKMASDGANPGEGPSSSTGAGASFSGGSEGGRSTSEQMKMTSTSEGDSEASTGSSRDDQGPVETEIHVVEPAGGPVDGAWIEVRADGERIDETISNAGTVSTEVPAGAEVEVVATHPDVGEGQTYAGVVDEDEKISVRLDMDLFARTAATDRIVWLDEIEEILETELVVDGPSWIVDRLEPNSAAAEAGLREGDAMLFLREENGEFLAVVERNGRILEFWVL